MSIATDAAEQGPAAVYIRRSDESQAETPTFQLDFAVRKAAELGLRFEGNHSDVRELIARRGGRQADVFLDEDISGSDLDRPGLNALLAEFTKPNCQYRALIVFRRDRLARPDDPIDGLAIERTIQKAGALLVFNDKTILPAKSRSEQLASDLMAMLDYNSGREELDGTSQRTLNAQISIAKRGAWTGGRAPYGFKRVLVGPDGNTVRDLADGEKVRQAGHFVSIAVGDPEKIALRIEILDKRKSRWGYKRIAKWLNERGIPSPDAGRTRRDTGVIHEVSGLWHPNTVANMWKDKIMLGQIEFGHYSEGKFHRFGGKDEQIRPTDASDLNEYSKKPKRIINPEHVRIVADAVAKPQYGLEEWNEIQSISDQRSKSQKGISRSRDPAKYPLASRVIDLTNGCGSPMYGKVRKRQVNKQPVDVLEYCCGAYMQHGKDSGCDNNHVDAEKLLGVILGRLGQTIDRNRLRERIEVLVREKLQSGKVHDTADRIAAVKNRIAESQRKMEQVVDNIAGESDEELKQRLRGKWKEFKADRDRLTRELNQLESVASRVPASTNQIESKVGAVLNDLRLCADSPEARRKISSALGNLDIWVGLEFTEVIQGKKRPVRKLRRGVICIGRHNLPIEVHGHRCRDAAQKKVLCGESENSSTKDHRDDRI